VSVIHARAIDTYAWGDECSWFVSHDATHCLTRLCGIASPRSSEASAAAIPEICHAFVSRYAAIASVARNERERPVERAIFSRRFFSAFRTRMVIVAVRGVSICVHCITYGVTRHEGSLRPAVAVAGVYVGSGAGGEKGSAE
jgi:hypothetical protein